MAEPSVPKPGRSTAPPKEGWHFRRRHVLLLIGLAGLGAAWALDLTLGGLMPRGSGFALWKRFFGAALQPAFTYEGSVLVEGTPPFLWTVVKSLGVTLQFALASMGIALLGGLVLGALASHSFWRLTPGVSGMGLRHAARVFFRGLSAVLRSVHELMWAMVFLAAIGLNDTAALLALSIPFTGILAKIFSELLDEAPQGPSEALLGLGASPGLALLVGRLPIAWPDMAAYAFYRFECAVRSSTVLGFFGFQTIGYHLELSYASLHYREVWTQLYAMLILVWLLERWSSLLRRQVTA